MEGNKKTSLLFVLLVLPHVCAFGENKCPSQPDKDLPCFTDFNQTISCEWNSTFVTDQADTVCTIHAKNKNEKNPYNSSCKLEPGDVNSRPKRKRCNLVFYRDLNFVPRDELTIDLTCNPGNPGNPGKEILRISYKPACHVKLNRPPKPEIKPDVNFTVVSWLPYITEHDLIEDYHSQLQWKRASQSWSDPLVQKEYNKFKQCEWACKAVLYEDQLIQNETYEARIRVQPADQDYSSTWSDWSPTVSWVSHIGHQQRQPTTKPPPQSDVPLSVLGTVAFAAALALLLILIKTDKTAWIYKVKRIGYPPVPNPENSFLKDPNFESWLSPFYQSGSSLSKTVDIVSLEVTSTLDAVAPCGPEATLLEKMRIESSCGSTSSSFSNPAYSPVCPPLLPVSSLTAGNLEPCGADTPYGPVACQSESQNAEQDRDEGRGKEVEILQLLSKSSNNSETMLVVSDYERVEKPQVERLRFQSLDSGVCSGEEVSQESLEADSINVTDGHDEEPEGNEEREGGGANKVDFQKLFGGGGGNFDKGSIQVCSGYEQVQKLQADSPELPSLDSGISSGGEEQLSQEESLEDIDKSTESTSLLFSPPPPSPPCVLACSSPSFTLLPFNFSGASLSPALRPLPSHMLERMTLMSTSGSVEPSGDGYMPVRQEQS